MSNSIASDDDACPAVPTTQSDDANTSTAASIAMHDIFTVGTLVTFKNTGLRGYVIAIHEDDDDDITCSVQYELERNRIEHDVSFCELNITAMGDTSSRSGTNRHATLPPSAALNAARSNNAHDVVPEYENMKRAIKLSSSFYSRLNCDPNTKHPLKEFLLSGKNKQKGWLREIFKKMDKNRKDKPLAAILCTNLTNEEAMVLNIMSFIITAFDPCHGIMKGAIFLLTHAFGIHMNTRTNLIRKFIHNDFSVERKTRKDKGESVFTSESKRRHVFTALNAYKKERGKEFRETTSRIPHATLAAEFDALSPAQKEVYETLAQQDMVRSRTIWDDLKNFLLKTKGKVPYSAMEYHLGHIVSKTTIMSILKSQEGYHMRKDRILPALDEATKKRRVVWAETFWWLWKMIRCCSTTNIQFVLIHMDEKWFYALRTRANCKVLTSIGLEPSDYYCHHKSHICKIMYVVVTAFVPIDNDITKGGKTIPIACVRVGRNVFAQKDSYKRVYRDDGTYHYPPLPQNRLQKRGDIVFKNLDITGSNEGTADKPKCSLLKIYKDEILPAIDEKVINVLNENGSQKVCVIKQEDSTGPHQDRTYCNEMAEEFARREWLIFNQPSQSPVTNVHDACIFPMMSKEVSKEQAVSFRSTLLRNEQLHQTVMKVWNNKSHRYAMSKAFAAHPQLVSAILEHKGDNNYLSEKGGLSFGIRRTYHRNEEGDGITLIDLAVQNENETIAGQLLANARAAGLKYAAPDLRTLKNAAPTGEMKEILMSYVEEELMTDDVRESWTQLLINQDG